jgi:hypothetical protein
VKGTVFVSWNWRDRWEIKRRRTSGGILFSLGKIGVAFLRADIDEYGDLIRAKGAQDA